MPLSHTITGKSADGTTNVPDGTSGFFIQAGLPLLPGIGIDNYKTKLKQGNCVGCWNIPIDLATTMYNLYYLLPIPIVNLTIGVGTGKTEYSYGGVAIDDGAATQWYTSFGVPIIPLFDLHLNYRSVSSKIKIISGGEHDLSGNVMGLGIGFNF